MNEALRAEWVESRGISVEKIALNPITLNPEDMKKIQDMEDAVAMGSNAAMMAGRMTTATANAMETAAGNSAGAMTGFMGMGMAGGAMGGGFNAAQNLYQQGQEQAKKTPEAGWKCACGAVNTGKFCTECGAKAIDAGWKCACGAVNTGKFCSECGAKKPAGIPQYKCDKCGWVPEDPTKAPRFCPECGDPFDNGDQV
jgi:membrane protease subunit (stomatin/prohibitin family)